MAFNMDKIKGYSSQKVGEGLLSDVSKGQMVIQRKTEYIPFSSIHPNPKNKMSMNGIDELASQIKLSGLEQPLVVYQQEDGSYMILTGHRRYTAIKTLIERGEWDAEKQLIECKVKDLESMKLPLELEEKEMLSILVTNQSREKTDADIAFEIKEWKKIIHKLKQQGIDFLVAGYDENGEPIKKDIAGMRTQSVVANQMGMSKSQVAKFDKVENQGSEKLQSALENGEININNAYTVASMPKEAQDEFIEKTLDKKEDGEQIDSKDVAVAVKELEDKKSEPKKKTKKNQEELPEGTISDKILKRDINPVLKALKTENVQLSENQYKDYCRYINGLKKIFGV